MDNVNIKYLEDENNNIISPVTSANSVYIGGGTSLNSVLDNMYESVTLFTGNSYTNFTLNDSVSNYEMLRFDITNNPDNGWTDYQTFESKFITLGESFSNATFTFNIIFYAGSIYCYTATTTITVNGTTVTQTNNRMTRCCNEASGTATMENKNNGIIVYGVTGYRRIQTT